MAGVPAGHALRLSIPQDARLKGARRMFFHVIAVPAVLVGIKGFTPGGLPVTNRVSIRGFWGKFVAGVCLALAAAAAVISPLGRYAEWAWRRVTGSATVEDRLEQYGPAARNRLSSPW